ncbi:MULTISPECIES: hypothetical protein [Streptomycetaceae]|uniref:hypothetical protein n=1 Tax=Streptomycetaceae TaxID=2062 RepID=UPI00093BEDBD|nr:hypothetical protein [Streptomyces sp. CB02056]OKI06419.1 hypothetical protein AMK13_17655 [Streptomyces sp. CB02056]
MATPRLDRAIVHGTPRDPLGLAVQDSRIVCADSFCLSVIAPDPVDVFLLPALTLEVGFPTFRPEPWDTWRTYLDPGSEEDDPTEAVYLYVPGALVRDLIESHGGEARLLPSQRS